ncbi:CysO-cysteine peptidase [bacterium HR32]|jgi:proteasome lid subunit RPN8/RPN11|nr:CysO-cysteine peptidase [bacterium HR32]
METLTLERVHLGAMVSHARSEAPNECCGVLAGRNGRVERVRPVANADRSPYTFRMDPHELLRAYQEADAEGLEVVGYYHSHPATPAVPSRTDVARAADPFAVYVIVSLASEPPEVRAYRIADGGYRELELRVR